MKKVFITAILLAVFLTGCESENAPTAENAYPLETVETEEEISAEEISAHGREAAAFLSQLPTLFSDTPIPVTGVGQPWERGRELEEGQFSLGMEAGEDGRWRDIISYEIPELYFRRDRDSNGVPTENHGFFTRDGEKITEAPWILGDFYATSFRLWDLDGSGIPVITLYYAGNLFDDTGNSGTEGKIFKYVNGEYVHFPTAFINGLSSMNQWRNRHTSFTQFYLDPSGNLVRSDIGAGGGYFVWFDHVNFLDQVPPLVRLTQMASYSFVYPASTWNNYVTGELEQPAYESWWDWQDLYRLPLYSMDIPLTQIEPLTQLAEEIREENRQ
ncbi:MAG: hypothetical protein FWB96_00505 [Defluviitaleaceae bacterium]|nr:hypothetical protein [Defluviitaleaceae bacterium]MCL2261806.1 hypothetical protein [Defluviitaleaceae bacterium]